MRVVCEKYGKGPVLPRFLVGSKVCVVHEKCCTCPMTPPLSSDFTVGLAWLAEGEEVGLVHGKYGNLHIPPRILGGGNGAHCT